MRTLAALFLFAIMPLLGMGQGVLTGFIFDENGLALPGATVKIIETSQGVYTDVQGKYTITGIDAGSYTLEVAYIGFVTQNVNATVVDNRSTVVSIRLESGYVSTDDVIVLGDRLIGQSKALNQQKNNPNITNIVSADQIGRFPDANIGDAMKRIPGITIINDQGEARFGLIRGTEPRFNSVMVNGERLPSAEKGSRTVQLDLIPSDMIQTIEVNKAVTPDMDADAIGGAANLVTRHAPNDFRISGSIGSGYNFLSNKPLYLGSLIAGKRFFDNRLGILVNGSYLNHVFGSDNVEFEWDRNKDTGNPFLTNAQIRKYDVQRIRRSMGATVDFRINPTSTLTFRSIYNLRDDYENRFRVIYSGMSEPNAAGLTRGRVEIETKGGGKNQKYTRQERQSTSMYSIGGDHLIGGKVLVDWIGSYGYAKEDRPNERYISFRTANLPLASGLKPNTENPEYAFVTPSVPVDLNTIPFRRFQMRNDFTDETDRNARLNISIPIATGSDFCSTVKVGSVYRSKEKLLKIRRGLLVPGTAPKWSDLDTKDYSDSGYLADGGNAEYRVGIFPKPENLQGFEQKFNATYQDAEIDNNSASYTGNERIIGGYAMVNQHLGRKLSAIVGFRIEQTKVEYASTQYDQDKNASRVIGDNSYVNVMPGVHFKYDISNSTVLRAAYTNTLARPNYEDLSPSRNVDIVDNILSTGNPDLKPTLSMNLDLMLEHYFKSVGIVSGGVFRKRISDFIYTSSIQNYRDPITGNIFLRATTPLNGQSADLTGIEVALQRQFDFLPGFWQGFGIYTNYTFSDSKATVLFYNEDEDETETVKMQLPGTSKHNFNASLSYENKKLQARVSLNYHSGFVDPDDTFLALSNAEVKDIRYLDRQLHVDANVAYAITPEWRFFIEANNLTNQPLRYYQGERERTMQAEYYNMRLQGGIKFDLSR